MKTYQDLLAVGANEQSRMEFCLRAIQEHSSSEQVLEALVNRQYYDGMNVTITQTDKFITDVFGKRVPDIWSPNHKIKCHLYPLFINQQVLFLLGNGISFSKPDTLDKLGASFEATVVEAAKATQNAGVSFGFWNYDHLEVFSLTEFVPLYDEETGRLSAGIRYWQLSPEKPLRITLFELDGYTNYIKAKGGEISVKDDKRPYVQRVTVSITGTDIAPGQPYPGFPIVPLEMHNKRSAMYGHRESIDGYDLIASRLLNNIDNFEFAYWIIKGAPALADDPEGLNELYQRLKVSRIAALGDGQELDDHRVEIPFEASKTALDFMRQQLFSDFMAFDPLTVAGGADTATQIKASYELLNEKTDLFEYQVTRFIDGILELADIDDEPTYTRSMIVNKQEEIASVLSAEEVISTDYTTRKVLEILGDADKIDEVLHDRMRTETERFKESDEVTEQ